MWFGNGMSGWGYVLMTLGNVLIWVLLVVGVVLLVRYLGRSHGGGDAASGAEQILAERFARGEIDGDEYQRRLDMLRAGRGRAPKA